MNAVGYDASILSTQSPPLTVLPAIAHLERALRRAIARGPIEPERQARRHAALGVLSMARRSGAPNTVAAFERVLNGCLDVGYRTKHLAAFAVEVLHDRLTARARKRLLSAGRAGQGLDLPDVVSAACEAIFKLIRGAARERHTLRYGLLVSIADHRAIDALRRRRPEYVDTMDDRPAEAGGWMATAVPSPEQALRVSRRFALAVRIRQEVFEAVNSLPTAQRAALVLVEIEGLGYSEVAERLDIKRTDVGNLTRRARLARDRDLSPRLRSLGIAGTNGFAALRSDRELRVRMVQWAAEVADGVCAHCVGRYHLHPAGEAC